MRLDGAGIRIKLKRSQNKEKSAKKFKAKNSLKIWGKNVAGLSIKKKLKSNNKFVKKNLQL